MREDFHKTGLKATMEGLRRCRQIFGHQGCSGSFQSGKGKLFFRRQMQQPSRRDENLSRPMSAGTRVTKTLSTSADEQERLVTVIDGQGKHFNCPLMATSPCACNSRPSRERFRGQSSHTWASSWRSSRIMSRQWTYLDP